MCIVNIVTHCLHTCKNYALHKAKVYCFFHANCSIVLISCFTKVHNLLVAAQNFITRNGCSENLSTSSSNWVSLVPRTIKFVEIQPSHVEEMRFLFGTEEFVKNCKAEIHDTVSDFNLVSRPV